MRRSRRLAARPSVESMESRSLMSATPAQVSVINPGIIVGSPGRPGVVTSETPRGLQVVVLSQAGAQPFDPATALVPGTIRVDGIAFPGATVHALPDSNGDGIPDAVINVSTRGLDLPAGPALVTVTGAIRYHAGGRATLWASASVVDVGESPRLGAALQFQGYIILTNQTTRTLYESLNVNAPPGGAPAANPGRYFPITSFVPLKSYTGPGPMSQLVIQANFSLSPSGANPLPVTFNDASMTVSSFPPSDGNIVHWYLHVNPATNQLYLNNRRRP